MIQIFKSPFEGVQFYDTLVTDYSYLSSTAFTVSVFDDVAQSYSSAFVYKCGHSKAWAPWQGNEYSVFGAGVTGYPVDYFSPWKSQQNAQFNYLTFGISDETKVKIGYKKGTVTSVDIGPYSKNLQYSIIAPSSIEISGLNPYDKISVIVNNDASTPLYLFADPIHTAPSPTSVDLYFSAGIWEISSINFLNGWDSNPSSNFRYNQLTSNSIVYFEGGSYVDGTFLVRGLGNVTFSGPGVIDAYRPDDWWEVWEFGATGKIDKDKLIRAPFLSYSSFSDDYYLTQVTTSGISINDITIVNNIIYGATCNIKTANNIKLIAQYPNCDGFHINDKSSPLSSRYASMTHSFLQTADDTCYPTNHDANVLISSCYFINLAGALFRNYAGAYNYEIQTGNTYIFSCIDIDCRMYSPPSFANINAPLNKNFRPTVFGLMQGNLQKEIALYPNFKDYVIHNALFSGIRIDFFDTYLFDLGVRSYMRPNSDQSDVFGSLSSIIFKDITASTVPHRKYNFPKSNLIYGAEQQYRVHDVSFVNVRIDGQPITNVNKDDYFYWYDRPIQYDLKTPVANPPYYGSSVVDLYVIAGDSIADGYDSKYSQRTGSIYEDLPSEITGCYIWVPYNYNATGNTGWVPRFETIRPGVNVPTNLFYNTPLYNGVHATGIAALESTLGWKLRQNSGDRDIYIVKYAQGGSMAVCGTSSINTVIPVTGAGPYYLQGRELLPQDWSISSTGEMFTGLSSTLTSALNNLRGQYKHIDFKGAVICLGTNLPIETMDPLIIGYDTENNAVTGTNPYLNAALVQSRIDTDLSSLIAGIRTIAFNNSVDTVTSKFIWMPPIWDSLGEYFVNQDALVYNNYFTSFRNKIKSLSSAVAPLSTNVSIRTLHYYAPTALYTRADFVHYNFSGYSQMAEDMYEIFQQQTSSVTDPSLNPDVNITFRISENPVVPYTKVGGAWKESDSYVKVNGEWKFSVPSIKSQTAWKGTPPENGVEIYNLGSEALRSSMYSVAVFNGNNFDNSYVYSSTARFGEGGASGARAAFSYDAGTGNYRNRLWYRNDKPIISYTTFGTSATSRVKISKTGAAITSADIRPRSKNYNSTISNGQLELSMNPKDKAWVTINGDVSNTLFVFCDPPKPAIPGSNILYFGPGIHHLSALAGAEVINASSPYFQTPGDGIIRTETFRGASYSALHNYGYVEGQPFTIYLDGGSYVIGQFDLRGKNNIKVIGPGVLAGDNIVEQCTRFGDDDFHTRTEPYGILSQLRAVNYAYQEQGLNTYDRVPSGLVVSGPTIVNTHMINMPGMNTVDNIKLLSPFMPNTDIKAPMPDGATSAAIMRDSLVFLGDDAIIPTPYNAYPTDTNVGYLNIGGRFDISGCQVYTTNGGPLVIPYFGVLYPSSTPNAYPIVIRDMDFGIYTYNEGGGGANGLPIDSEHGEVAIRVTMDMSSIYSGTWPNGTPKFGIHNVTVSNIRFDDPIDQALFWVGNVPDPYFPIPVSFRGDEYGHVSGITFKNISVSSITGFEDKLYSNLIFAKNSTNRPKNITFENIRLDGTYLTNSNYSTYFTLSGIDATAPNLISDNITFVTGT